MKFTTVQVKFDAAKLTAAKQYMEKKDLSIDQELEETIARLYEKHVPAAVREYIEFNADSGGEAPPKPRKFSGNAAETGEIVSGFELPKPDGISRQSV